MKHFIISLLLILHISLRAQTLPDRPYEKIFINDITPEWYFVNYDVDMDNDTFDGYNNFLSIESFDHLFYNNAIYEVFYRQNYIEPTGTYVQKRSLDDGTLLWRQYIGYPRDKQQIFGRNLLINDKDQLEVIFQVKCDPYNVFHPLLGRTNMALYQIEFDTENGNVINEINIIVQIHYTYNQILICFILTMQVGFLQYRIPFILHKVNGMATSGNVFCLNWENISGKRKF
ncbi:MAG: hypothetical protein IPN79_14095 [Saprospiraceae bacterium]|nr:hypothetical protein [Saprospiraceae bacterium]